jgi:tetratricopeptide (TPR) repeat protein
MQLSRPEFPGRFAFFAIGLVFFPVAVALGGDSTAAQNEQLINVATPQIILAPQSGDGKVDREIARVQQAVRNARNPNFLIERLGWTFVAKARQSFDPGYYKLAEQCAFYLDSRQPGSDEALLLRGHVLHNLHRFKAAEPLARELATKRGLAADFGLLGDVLMEQGRLKEATKAYQTMLDLKPSLHSYARAAHLRWLKGDMTGAIEAMQLAVAASSPLDAESAAWVNTRLAFYQFQAGDNNEARRTADIALTYQHDYAPALLLRGRMKLSEGKVTTQLRKSKPPRNSIRCPNIDGPWPMLCVRQAVKATHATSNNCSRRPVQRTILGLTRFILRRAANCPKRRCS